MYPLFRINGLARKTKGILALIEEITFVIVSIIIYREHSHQTMQALSNSGRLTLRGHNSIKDHLYLT